MASLARSVPLACACFAALEAASLTAAGAGCQSGGPCTQDQPACLKTHYRIAARAIEEWMHVKSHYLELFEGPPKL